MKCCALGSLCMSGLVAVAGATALGAGGYMVMSGKSLCSLVASCGDKAKEGQSADAKTVKTVADKESGAKKGCCPLAKQAKAKGTCGEAKVAAVKPGYVVLGAAYPVVMPAAFYSADAKVCEASLKEINCAEEAKTACKSAKAAGKVVDAKAADPACCKGTGVRADGQPCKKDGDHCTKGEKAAEGQTPREGEPVASR